MADTTCHMSISLDGFVAGPDQGREHPLGKRGLELHAWHLGDERANEADAAAEGRLLRRRGAYETALDRLGEAVGQVDVVVPGHGGVAEGPEVAARLAADRAYIDALRRGEDPADARLADAEWMSGPHRSNLEQARA